MKSDSELIKEVRKGSQQAFADLVRRHQSGLVRLCTRLIKDVEQAEDIVQESFVKAYRNIGSFEERSTFKSWLYQIAVNTAKNKLRSFRSDYVSLDSVVLSVKAEAESQLIRQHIQTKIRASIDQLPERQRVALTLRVYEDLSFKEIAEIMECPYDTAKANYRHGMLKLKEFFEGDEQLREWAFSDPEANISTEVEI